MTSLPPLRDVIQRFGLGARKSLGQHFLLDGNITAKIVRMSGTLKGLNVIEIARAPAASRAHCWTAMQNIFMPSRKMIAAWAHLRN